ncbi:hypothetical protein K7432_004197 [Basidiobolus ranarum]|uniref:Ras-GEF domain-containing protein n=1 Tax=Basidiobolus ranarum TaxID=34480 RepID=A0ABR2W4Z9_9FUNG
MEEIQQFLKRASACQGDGVFEDAYFFYLNTLETATNTLRSVVFEKQVIIKKPRLVNQIFDACQKSVAEAHAIIQKHSMNIETQAKSSQISYQSLQDSLQQELNKNEELEFRYQTNTPRKRMVTTKPLKRLAIIHDDFQPMSVFSDENYDWSCDDSDQSTSLNSPENDVFSAISPPDSPDCHLYEDSIESELFSAISPPDSPNYHTHKAPTLSIPKAMILPQQTYIHIVPEGSVDPLNLVPAQVDNEETLTNHHVPLIPKSPLLISYHTLSEKLEAVNSEMVVLHNVCRKNSVHTLRPEQHKQKEDSAMIEKAQGLNLTITETQSTLGKINNLVQLAAASTHITTFPPRLVAYQLTLIESALFQRIPPNAFLTHSPRSPHPAIVASTDFFNYLTRVIEMSILSPMEASDRAQILNHWIRIASRLYDLCNFQTLKAVLSATGTPPVQRLKRTWNCIPKKTLSRLDSLRELMSEDNNYGKYREITIGGDMLSDVNTSKHILPLTKPTVPFLGVFIMDITYLLAATKKSGTNTAPMSPATPYTFNQDKGKSTSLNRLEDDPRVQTLLSVLRCYLAGPKYPSTPSQNFLKSKSKFFPFSSNSLSSENPGSPLGYEKPMNNRHKKKELDSIYTTQQVILHYLLSQPWITERQVDEISMSREPKKKFDKLMDKTTPSSTSTLTYPTTLSTASSNHSSIDEETVWEKQHNGGIRDALGSIKNHLHFTIGHSPNRYGDQESKLGSRKPSLPNMHRIKHTLGTPPAEELPNYEFSFANLEISPPIPITPSIRNTLSSRIPRSSKSAESLRNFPGISVNTRLTSDPRDDNNPTIYEEPYSPEDITYSTEETENPLEVKEKRRVHPYKYSTKQEMNLDSFKTHHESNYNIHSSSSSSPLTSPSLLPSPLSLPLPLPSTPTKSTGSNMFSKRFKPLTRTIRNITS